MLAIVLYALGVLTLLPILFVGARLAYFTYYYKSIVARLPKELPRYKSKDFPFFLMFDSSKGKGYEAFLSDTGIFDETGQPEPHWFGVSSFYD